MACTTEKYISPLQFITMDGAPYTHLEQVSLACQAGVPWIQLRMKEATEPLFLDTAINAKNICDQHDCRLIINDRVSVARTVGAYGLHLGKEDMPVIEARRLLGPGVVIGGTANTAADILEHYRQGADYIGLGPYRFTATKKKLSPILGLAGYRDILDAIRRQQVQIPVIAIGGIREEDIDPLCQTGIHGIAVSGLLLRQMSETTARPVVHSLIHKTLFRNCTGLKMPG